MARSVWCGFAVIAMSVWMAGCASVPEAPKYPDYALPESFYAVQPWATQSPVNITRRVAALQSALGSMQQAVNSYGAALQAQADQHNRQVFRQAELARAEEEARRQQAIEAQRLRNAAAPKPALRIKTKPLPNPVARPSDNFGWKLGEAMYQNVHGWTDWNSGVMQSNIRQAPN